MHATLQARCWRLLEELLAAMGRLRGDQAVMQATADGALAPSIRHVTEDAPRTGDQRPADLR